jgi:hypothetical protein
MMKTKRGLLRIVHYQLNLIRSFTTVAVVLPDLVIP